MGNGHDHSHDHGNQAAGNIRVAFWLNTFFALVEILGGFYTNSVAILSDALHDLGDSLSLGISWYFQRKSIKRGDHRFSYGYQRFSLVGALATSIVLAAGSVFILFESVRRLFHPEKVDAKGMVLIAVVGLVVNLAALLRLRKGRTMTEEIVSLHFLEDVLGWAAVFGGSIVMVLADLPVLDPILSILVSLYILSNVGRNLVKVFRILLQGVPANVSEQEIRREIGKIEGVVRLHHIHIWTMDGQLNVMTLHAVVEPYSASGQQQIKDAIRDRLKHLNIQHATIELESGRSSARDRRG